MVLALLGKKNKIKFPIPELLWINELTSYSFNMFAVINPPICFSNIFFRRLQVELESTSANLR